MVKVNFFVLATDYNNIKLSNHLVLIQYQFNSYDILEPTVAASVYTVSYSR